MSEEHNFLYTQYIIMNSDVKMGKGKAIAQACHASLGAYLNSNVYEREVWMSEGFRKVILKATENEILELYETLNRIYIPDQNRIPTYIVKDFGLTQLVPGTLTCLGIGPYDIEILREYVKDLKLV